jgi:hypothetical protein
VASGTPAEIDSMHFPDLSPYVYSRPEPGTLNVGWLDGEHPFPTAEPAPALLESLAARCDAPPPPDLPQCFGGHLCELCQAHMDTGEIRVPGRGERVYAAPRMILHYVAAHRYLPPPEFVQALLEAPPEGWSNGGVP